MTAIPLSAADFDHHMATATVPTLVDFWSTGCGPCAALRPHVDELARNEAGRLHVAAVKLDDAPELAARYAIMALPTLILFVDGRPAKRITDVKTKQQILNEIDALLTG